MQILCEHCSYVIHHLNLENNHYKNIFEKLNNDIKCLELNNLSYDNLLLNILFILINKYIGNLKDFLHIVYLEKKVKQIDCLRDSINKLNYDILKVYHSKYFFNNITFNMVSDIFHKAPDNIVYKKIFLINHDMCNLYGLNYVITGVDIMVDNEIPVNKDITLNKTKVYKSFIDYNYSYNHICSDNIEKNNSDLNILQGNITIAESHKKYLTDSIITKKNLIKNIILGERMICLNNKLYDPCEIKILWERSTRNTQIQLLKDIITELKDLVTIDYVFYKNKPGWK